jgi:hypothetical protein
MNTLKLIQMQGFTRNEFILSEDTLSVKQFTISENKEWIVRLEDLGHKKVLEKDTSYMRKGLLISMGLFSILFVIANVADHSNHMKTWVWILLSSIYAWFATVVYLSPLNNKLLLGYGSQAIEFLSDKPSEKEVQDFVDEIINRSTIVMQRKYGSDIDF